MMMGSMDRRSRRSCSSSVAWNVAGDGGCGKRPREGREKKRGGVRSEGGGVVDTPVVHPTTRTPTPSSN